jgi:hypothetical protein
MTDPSFSVYMMNKQSTKIRDSTVSLRDAEPSATAE